MGKRHVADIHREAVPCPGVSRILPDGERNRSGSDGRSDESTGHKIHADARAIRPIVGHEQGVAALIGGVGGDGGDIPGDRARGRPRRAADGLTVDIGTGSITFKSAGEDELGGSRQGEKERRYHEEEERDWFHDCSWEGD